MKESIIELAKEICPYLIKKARAMCSDDMQRIYLPIRQYPDFVVCVFEFKWDRFTKVIYMGKSGDVFVIELPLITEESNSIDSLLDKQLETVIPIGDADLSRVSIGSDLGKALMRNVIIKVIGDLKSR